MERSTPKPTNAARRTPIKVMTTSGIPLSQVLTWLSGIPLVVITLIGVRLAALVGFGVLRSMNPRSVFRDTFHQAPSHDIRHLKSKVWSFADSRSVFMRFETNPETF